MWPIIKNTVHPWYNGKSTDFEATEFKFSFLISYWHDLATLLHLNLSFLIFEREARMPPSLRTVVRTTYNVWKVPSTQLNNCEFLTQQYSKTTSTKLPNVYIYLQYFLQVFCQALLSPTPAMEQKGSIKRNLIFGVLLHFEIVSNRCKKKKITVGDLLYLHYCFTIVKI